MKHSVTDLCSADAAHETVASFDIATLSMHFDRQYLVSTEELSHAPKENLDAAIHQRVPTSVLAHEIAHIWQTAATPAGLRDILNTFQAEFSARKAVTEAARISDGRLRVGVHRMIESNDRSSHLVSAYQQALATHTYMAFRIGGLRFSADLLNEEDSANRFRDYHFFIAPEDASAKIRTLLGVRHIYEGFGAAVELLRLSLERSLEPRDIPPANPYTICYQLYRNRRTKSNSQIRGSLFELAVVLDTTLMMDDWMTGSPTMSMPAQSFLQLLDLLEERPELELRRSSNADIVHFQDELLSAIGAPIPSVSSICDSMLDFLPTFIEDVKAHTAVPGSVVERYASPIRSLLRMRLDVLGGACPIRFLAFQPRRSLELLLGAFPQISTAVEMPVTEGNQDLRDVFTVQVARHLRPVVDELVFGSRPCPVVNRCILPHRPACDGVTHQLVSLDDRCPREAVISHGLSEWRINELDSS
jgi:hypothetical protein